MSKINKKKLLKMMKAQARKDDINDGINTISYNRIHKNKKKYCRKNYKPPTE